MKKFLSVILAALMVLSMGTVAFAAEDGALSDAISSVVEKAPEEVAAAKEAVEEALSVPAGAVADAPKADASAELASAADFWSQIGETLKKGDILEAIKLSFAEAKQNIEALTLNDVLALPSNVMSDIVTYFFAALKALGVDVDAVYAKLSKSKLLNWFANFYYTGKAAVAPVPTPEKKTTKAPSVPATGSSASIAVFATLSLAAAAAFVCYKKKEA
ncbi:MAG: hypothetical protein K6F09_02545 [Clostridiales bacterium]|nr:hypothetical protein [Clostridiales bacterium]